MRFEHETDSNTHITKEFGLTTRVYARSNTAVVAMTQICSCYILYYNITEDSFSHKHVTYTDPSYNQRNSLTVLNDSQTLFPPIVMPSLT